MHKVSGAGHLTRVAQNASAGRTLRWDPRRAAGVSKEDKERERREEGEGKKEGRRSHRQGPLCHQRQSSERMPWNCLAQTTAAAAAATRLYF